MFFDRLVNIHLNDRNKTAIAHRLDCPFGHTRKDSKGKWVTRVKESVVSTYTEGYKHKHCSKCSS